MVEITQREAAIIILLGGIVLTFLNAWIVCRMQGRSVFDSYD